MVDETNPLFIAREQARIAFEVAMDARKEAQRVEAEALTAWAQARVAWAKANPPELANKPVKRVVMQRGRMQGIGMRAKVNPDRARTERGTVTLYADDKQGFHLRNHAPIPGEWFVLSASGNTAYSLTDIDNNVLWELDEG